MDNRMPYYMTYPVPFYFDDDRMSRRDQEYMKSMYPDTARRLIPLVEKECDRLEYDGSMLYDEYPDRLQVRLLCRRIYERAKEREENPGKWLNDLIEVMACQELCRRRQEHRSYRKRLY